MSTPISSPSRASSDDATFGTKQRNVSNTYTIIEHEVEHEVASSPAQISLVSSPISLANSWLGGITECSLSAVRGDASSILEVEHSVKTEEEIEGTSSGPVLQALRPISEIVLEEVLSESKFIFPKTQEEEEEGLSDGSQRSASSSSTSTSASSTSISTSKRHRRTKSSSVHSLLPSSSLLSPLVSRFPPPASSLAFQASNRISGALNRSVPKSAITSSITKASASCLSISTASSAGLEPPKSEVSSTSRLHSSYDQAKSPSSKPPPFRNPFSSVAEQELRIAHAHILLRDDTVRRRAGSMSRKGFRDATEGFKQQPQRKRSWSIEGNPAPSALPSSPSSKALSTSIRSGFPSPKSPGRGQSGSPRTTNLSSRHKRNATASDVSRVGKVGFEMRARIDGSGPLGVQSINAPMISPRSGAEAPKENITVEDRNNDLLRSSPFSASSSSSPIDLNNSGYIGSGSRGRTTSHRSEKMLLRPSASLSAHLSQKEIKLGGFHEHSDVRIPSNLSIRERRIASSKLKRENEKRAEKQGTLLHSAMESQIRPSTDRKNDGANKSFTSSSQGRFNSASFSNDPPPSPPTSPDAVGRQTKQRIDEGGLLSFGSLLKRSNTISTGIAGFKSILSPASDVDSNQRTASSPISPTFTPSRHLTRSSSSRGIDPVGIGFRGRGSGSGTSVSTNAFWKVPSREDPLPSPISPTDSEGNWQGKRVDLRLRIDSYEASMNSSTSQKKLYREEYGGLTPPLTATSGGSSTGYESESGATKEGGSRFLAVGQYLSSKVATMPSSSSVQSLLSFNFNLSSQDLRSSPAGSLEPQDGSAENECVKEIGYLSPPLLPSWIRKRAKSSEETSSGTTRVTSPSWKDDSIVCPSNPIPINLPSFSSSALSISNASSSSNESHLRPHPRSDWSQDRQEQHRKRNGRNEKRGRELSPSDLDSLRGDRDETEIQSRKLSGWSSLDRPSRLPELGVKAIHSHSSICLSSSFSSSSGFVEPRRQPTRSRTHDETVSNSNANFHRMTSSNSALSTSPPFTSNFKPQNSNQYRPAFRANASLSESEEVISWEDQLSSFF